ncbi:phosphonate metabolism transcriptional regulator PhnF [Propylenella binzhouense]|uniref:Phosphonate metabolism transcriptional regulator PhnF n=1 Tax=Propylenella binzhouense TaxID=2555902 RepID=A0A964T5R7_9HYPH|nr:phosphonate metabolism transcriptional regulator PhnF [Propylenella binzhouense]MYZ48973.1 phosphonate metabolism transcriptional regulator PhnF [Propylenella binzhouense]
MTETTIFEGDVVKRSAGVSLWKQIADALRAELDAGAWPAGTALPPESALAARFGVNRHTLRRAVATLAAEGLVRSDHGRGTFVLGERLAYPIGRRTRFSEIVSRQARAPAGRLLESGGEPAGEWLAELLRVEKGAELVRIETLGVADGVPISNAVSWFPAARFPRLVDAYAETGSITSALARHGVDDYWRRWTRVTARTADAAMSRRLDLAPGAAILLAEALNEDAEGVPVHYSETRFAAERIEIVIEPDAVAPA